MLTAHTHITHMNSQSVCEYWAVLMLVFVTLLSLPGEPFAIPSPVLTHAARPPAPPIYYNTQYHMCNTVCMYVVVGYELVHIL